MRNLLIAVSVLAVAACNRAPDGNSALKPTPASVSYDGADYSDDAAKVAHGEHVARVVGCTGCHGETYEGQNITAPQPEYGAIWAKNISLILPTYSDEELRHLLRDGVPKDGRMLIFMPSEMYTHLSDRDYDALVAYLRTIKPAGKPTPPVQPGPGLEALAKANGLRMDQTMVEQWKDKAPADLGPDHALGRYITQTACIECHNSELQGYETFSPDLDIAGTYNADEFKTLMTTGKGKVKADLGPMSWAAMTRFRGFTPHERDALFAYLQARANRPQPPQ